MAVCSERAVLKPQLRFSKDASASFLRMSWSADSVCAMRAQSSVRRTSSINLSIVFVFCTDVTEVKERSGQFISPVSLTTCLSTNAGKQVEQDWGYDTPQSHIGEDLKGPKRLSPRKYKTSHAVMKQTDKVHKHSRSAKFLMDCIRPLCWEYQTP